MLLPLRLKLSMLTSVLLVGTIGMVSTLVVQRATGGIEAEVRKRARFMAINLARSARDATLLDDELQFAQLLRSVAAEPGVVVARLVGENGELVGSSLPGEKGPFDRLARESPLAVIQQGDELTVTARMRLSGVDLGEAQVVLDIASIVGPVARSAARDIAIAAIGLLCLGIAIAIAMSARITQPLQRLRFAVNALAAGDTSAQVPVSTRDEVADLTKAFNEMSRSLHDKKRVETAFRRYVSDHVLREVLESGEAVQLQGERREVTVLFADIRKFSQLASEIDPERLVAYLNGTFELMTNRLLDHGATVDKYLGDAVLAYFGAPIETPDHAARALAAAIAIQRSLRERTLKLEAKGQAFDRIEVGIGIQTGEVVVGNIGSELKMDYTAIGDPVNVASRLQKLAAPGEIMLTRAVADRLADMIELESLGQKQLEGREEPIEVLRAVF